MIIKSIAPSRISLFGGSTDIPDYYLKYGGVVISMAINLQQRTIYGQMLIQNYLLEPTHNFVMQF